MKTSQLQVASRKRWMRLIPLVFITYSLAYLDRANYGFGVAGGMGRTLTSRLVYHPFWPRCFSLVISSFKFQVHIMLKRKARRS